MTASYFITGTDTEIGKTWSTVALMRALQQQGKQVLAMKPVSAGCEQGDDGQWYNSDALLLQQYGSRFIDYAVINPYAYRIATSPHLAGADRPLQWQVLANNLQQLQQLSDVVLVEGAGGWYSPLTEQAYNRDIARQLHLPVILVVGIKLGCINHALVTYHAIQADCDCIGWFAVCLNPDLPYLKETINSIQTRLSPPLLGLLPYTPTADFDYLARYVDLNSRLFT